MKIKTSFLPFPEISKTHCRTHFLRISFHPLSPALLSLPPLLLIHPEHTQKKKSVFKHDTPVLTNHWKVKV